PLVRLFYPRALDPPTLLEAIEQRIQGIDVKPELAARPCVNQLAEVIAVPWPRIEQREDEQFRGSSLQLAVEGARVDICHGQIVCKQAWHVNAGLDFGRRRI